MILARARRAPPGRSRPCAWVTGRYGCPNTRRPHAVAMVTTVGTPGQKPQEMLMLTSRRSKATRHRRVTTGCARMAKRAGSPQPIGAGWPGLLPPATRLTVAEAGVAEA